MTKRRRVLLAGAFLFILGLLAWKPLHLDEPWYQGRPLSGWLDEYGPGPRGYRPSPEADAALRHIGPKAVPYLLNLLHSTNSHSGNRIWRAGAAGSNFLTSVTSSTPRNATNISVSIRLMLLVEKHTPVRFHRFTVPPSWDHWQAYLGFQALGPLGKAAIPDLVKLARDPSGTSYLGEIDMMIDTKVVAKVANYYGTYVTVDDGPHSLVVPGGHVGRDIKHDFLIDGEIGAFSLAAIGAESVPPLMELLTDSNPRVKARAAVALGVVGGAAETAVPELIECLKNSDADVRNYAADALGWIGQRPDLAVPALAAALNDPEFGVNGFAARSLGNFHENAISAIPALLTNLSATNNSAYFSAVALSKISPETTEKEVVPVLLSWTKDRDELVRLSATITLTRIGFGHLLPGEQ